MLHKASVVRTVCACVVGTERERSADKQLIREWLVSSGSRAAAFPAKNNTEGWVPGSCGRVWSAAWRRPPAGWRRSSAPPHCRGRRRRWSALWCRSGPARSSRPATAADSRSCETNGEAFSFWSGCFEVFQAILWISALHKTEVGLGAGLLQIARS